MSAKKWLVVGISGVTCSGKSSLANRIHAELKSSVIVCQDDYFLPKDDPRHVRIPELNHNNWEILSSLDMERMCRDVERILGSTPPAVDSRGSSGTGVLIIEGFLIFKCKSIAELCDLRYFISLTKEKCRERRSKRTYDPPDVPGYFEMIVWPECMAHQAELKIDKDLCKTIVFIDGSKSKEEIFQTVSTEINEYLS